LQRSIIPSKRQVQYQLDEASAGEAGGVPGNIPARLERRPREFLPNRAWYHRCVARNDHPVTETNQPDPHGRMRIADLKADNEII
jgi:hypothetical protein